MKKRKIIKATEADKEALKILQKYKSDSDFTPMSVLGLGIRRPVYRLDRLTELGFIKKSCTVTKYNPGFLPAVVVLYSLIIKS